jgi:hypothetical protein
MPADRAAGPIRRAMSGLHPDLMTPNERLDEVARLLALGYLRLRARRLEQKANNPNHLREFGLDFRGEGSVGDTDAHAHRERA